MPSADFSRQTLFRPNPFSLGHRLLILKLLGISSARSLGVRHTSFTVQPFDLSSWRYVCLLGFGLLRNLTRHLALYQVSVRRLDRFATPLPSPRPHGLRLAVCYTWRQIPVAGLSPTRCVSCPTHVKKNACPKKGKHFLDGGQAYNISYKPDFRFCQPLRRRIVQLRTKMLEFRPQYSVDQ